MAGGMAVGALLRRPGSHCVLSRLVSGCAVATLECTPASWLGDVAMAVAGSLPAVPLQPVLVVHPRGFPVPCSPRDNPASATPGPSRGGAGLRPSPLEHVGAARRRRAISN